MSVPPTTSRRSSNAERAANALIAAGIVVAALAAARTRPPWPDGVCLDPNAATAAEMTLLPGVGPRLAEAIVLERERAGPFTSIDDLDRVPRVGRAVIERAGPYLELRDADDR